MFGILAYSLTRPSTTSTYHPYNLSSDRATVKLATQATTNSNNIEVIGPGRTYLENVSYRRL